MRRFVVVLSSIACLAIPVSMAGLWNGPASAASSVTCKKLVGTITGNVKVSACLPTSKTEKSASAPAASLASGGTLTWNSGKTTTLTLSTSSPGQGACKKGSSEYDATGTVTGGTSTYTHAGDVVSGRVCVNTTTGAISLVPKTVMSL
jgi:hypothetical protein